MDLRKVNYAILRRVKSSNSGDAMAKSSVEALASTWNGPHFQALLTKLTGAPREVSETILPKLKLLFTAVESMGSLTEVYFNLSEQPKFRFPEFKDPLLANQKTDNSNNNNSTDNIFGITN
jgi:hypothetical protein